MGDSNDNTTSSAPAMTEQELDEVISNMTNEEIYCLFAVNLLAEKGYTDLQTPEGQEMILELVPRIEAFITQELYLALPEKQTKELDGLINLEAASPEELQKLYDDANINMDDVVSGAMEKFREIYLNGEEEA